MLNDRDSVTLSNLDGGALQEIFEAKLPEVLSNIRDPNTKAETQREINISIKIKPSKSRKEAELIYGIKTKLAAATEQSTTVFIGKGGPEGDAALYEYPQDQDLPLETNIREAAEESKEDGSDGKVLNIGQRSANQ